jgi:hypothetical protein
MPNFPVRGVGAGGIVTDRSPYDLDLNTWSNGLNVRFSGGNVERYSVFRDAYPNCDYPLTADGLPSGILLRRTPTDERSVYCTRDFQFLGVDSAGAFVDFSPTSGTFAANDLRYTNAFVGGVTYVNRSDEVPHYITPAGTEFAVVPDWPETYTAASVREFGDFLIALNVTKDTSPNQALYKWTDAIQYGTVASFDLTPEGTLAGENVLNDAQSGLVDGLSLRNSFMMYTSTDVYALNYIGGDFIFETDRLFADDGVIALNCVVEVNNKHYVFGTQDLYVHDGITKESLTARRVHKNVFSIIDFANRDKCFVYHDSAQSEIGFAFPTLLDEVTPSTTGGCNMAAVYNYADDTWTYVQLPNAVGSVTMRLNASEAWSSQTLTWADMDTAWTSFEGSEARTIALASSGDATERPRTLLLDHPMKGRSSMPVVSAYQYESVAERVGMDMDNIGAEITGRKMLKRLLPQVATLDPDAEFYIQLGRSRFSGSDVIWEPRKRFDPFTMYKLDTRNTGRYLAIRIIGVGGTAFELSGYDLDLIQISRR